MRASASPIPRAAPVIKATFPVSRFAMVGLRSFLKLFQGFSPFRIFSRAADLQRMRLEGILAAPFSPFNEKWLIDRKRCEYEIGLSGSCEFSSQIFIQAPISSPLADIRHPQRALHSFSTAGMEH